MDRPTYERPTIDDFGSLWENTFANPHAAGKKGGMHCDAHNEMSRGNHYCESVGS